MKVGITGASGFIGMHLIRRLRTRGHKAVVFTREGGGRPAATVSTRPFPAEGPPDLRGLDAVVNLSGESILGWWTQAKKRRVLASRIRTTKSLIEGLAAIPAGKRPRVLVNASAVGFYGNAGDEVLDEGKPAGTGFLAETCHAWEDAALLAEPLGVRVARLRIGVVLGQDGGAFVPQRKIFAAGLGGRLGDGRQWTSPVHIEDVVGLIVFLLEREGLTGAFNAACPEPIRNADFTQALAKTLGKRAVLPAPTWLLRTVLGEASHILLDSTRAVPVRALEAGYAFRFSTPEAILADVCSTVSAPKDPQTGP